MTLRPAEIILLLAVAALSWAAGVVMHYLGAGLVPTIIVGAAAGALLWLIRRWRGSGG